MSSESRAAATTVTPLPETATPLRLGLALSGGGFRATIYHLGVLIRLAELDLLRHLHVISSVSGGSVLAAHYMLRLKAALEASPTGTLTREQYIALVARVRDELCAGIAKQLRCRLLAQPWDLIRMQFLNMTPWRLDLSTKMAALYQRELYHQATRELRGATPGDIARGMSLSRMHVQLAALAAERDIERFNASGAGDHVPKLVLNSATLNTACKFTFTFSELGDEMLGFIRSDERWLLSGYKLLMAAFVPAADLTAAAQRAADAVAAARRAIDPRDRPDAQDPDRFELRRLTVEHLAWWHAAHEERAARRTLHSHAPAGGTPRGLRASDSPANSTFKSAAVRHLLASADDSVRFLDALPGTLRQAKLAAWYVLDGERWPAGEGAGSAQRGGFTLAEHRVRFWLALRDVDAGLAAAAQASGAEADWLEFVLELYYLRVAENLHPGRLEEITLPTAVQASANFPPVFAPLELRALYDRKRVRSLKLSDGGLNDNNGLESLLDERCTHIIASEAGPRPGISRDVPGNRAGMLAQIVLNQLTIVRRLQLKMLREQARVHESVASVPLGVLPLPATAAVAALRPRYPVEAVAFFQIDSKLSDGVPESARPLAPHALADDIVRLRTDLDGFAPVEQDALIYQGYAHCDRFVRRWLYPSLVARKLVPPEAPPARAPAPLPRTDADYAHARRVLVAGRSLFHRSFRIGGGWRLAYLAALVLVLGAEVAAFFLVHALLEGAVRLPFLPHSLSLTWRWVIGWLSFTPDLSWVTFVLFGQAMRIDGLLAGLAARTPADSRPVA